MSSRKARVDFEKETLLDRVNRRLGLVDSFLVASGVEYSDRPGCVRLEFGDDHMSEWEFDGDIPKSMFRLDGEAFAAAYRTHVQNVCRTRGRDIHQLEDVWMGLGETRRNKEHGE